MPTIVFEIAGVDRASMLAKGTLRVADDLGGRATLRAVLNDTTGGGYHPEEGDEVVVTYDGDLIYGGSVERVKWRKVNGATLTRSEIEVVDYNQIPDRHLVARTYENMTAGDIVRDIVENDLVDEGISIAGSVLAATGSEIGPTSYIGSAVVGSFSLGGVVDGPVIERAVFNYVSAAAAFDELAQLVGFHWTIGYDKLLTFAPREQVRAPFDVTEAAKNFREMDVERSRSQYRNLQYLRAGVDVTDPRTETIYGDGANQTFAVAFPVYEAPTVEVSVGGGAFSAQTVGIRGVDADGSAQWYWNKGENQITQDTGDTPIAAADRLRVTYRGTFPIIIAHSEPGEIESRASTEGGSGIYEAIEEDASLDSVTLAQAKAAAMLRKYGRIPENVTFETDDPGLRAGQLVTITSAEHGVDGDYLIESVDTEDIGVGEQFMRNTVRATSGERLDNWVDFFRKVSAMNRPKTIRENEQLASGRTIADAVAFEDDLTADDAAYDDAEIGTAIVGYAEVAA